MSRARVLLEERMPFKEFDQATLNRLHEDADEITFSSGEVIFSEMTKGDEIYFIIEGHFRMAVEMASTYHMIEEIDGGAGELIGEGRFLSNEPRPATVTATSDVKALVWHVDDWKKLAEQQPLVGYRLAIYAGRILFSRVNELKQHLLNDIAWGID